MEENNKYSEIWEKLISLSNNLPNYVNEVNPLLQSLDQLFKSKERKTSIDHMLSVLTKLNNMQLKNETSTKADADNDKSLTGDSFYDIFNSPGMHGIVREVLDSKNKKRKKK